MIVKILFVLTIILSYTYFRQDPVRKKQYFFLAVLLTVIREINVEPFGDIVPSALMFWVMFIAELMSDVRILKSWGWYLLLLILAFAHGGLDVQMDRVLEWENPLWLVPVVATLIPRFVTDDNDMQRFVKSILIVAFIFSFSAIISYCGIYDGVVILHIDNGGFLGISRIYGISYSNLVQTVSVICICLLPYLDTKKWIRICLLLVFCYGALITLKRMSLIAMALSMTYYTIVCYRRNDRSYLWLFLIVVVAAFQLTVLDSIIDRFNIFSEDSSQIVDHSAYSRVQRIQFAMEEFRENPIFGGGAGAVTYIHNGFIEILANCGIIGVLVIFGRLLYPAKDVFKLNPWSVMCLIFTVTCLSLEAALSRPELMLFMGLFMGGYAAERDWGLSASMSDSHDDEE